MPRTAIRVYRHSSGTVPFKDWLDELEVDEPRAYRKCLERVLQLAALGHELRRPLADSLRDGIHELRARIGKVHYRPLYFFCGPNMACLSHGIVKEDVVPDAEIEAAVRRKRLVERNLERYTADWEI